MDEDLHVEVTPEEVTTDTDRDTGVLRLDDQPLHYTDTGALGLDDQPLYYTDTDVLGLDDQPTL